MTSTCARNIPLLVLIGSIMMIVGQAAACSPPLRPFLPQSRDDMRAYADLIRDDFEAYFTDIQDYFRCLDEERARVFTEAQEVSSDYGRFIAATR